MSVPAIFSLFMYAITFIWCILLDASISEITLLASHLTFGRLIELIWKGMSVLACFLCFFFLLSNACYLAILWFSN